MYQHAKNWIPNSQNSGYQIPDGQKAPVNLADYLNTNPIEVLKNSRDARRDVLIPKLYFYRKDKEFIQPGAPAPQMDEEEKYANNAMDLSTFYCRQTCALVGETGEELREDLELIRQMSIPGSDSSDDSSTSYSDLMRQTGHAKE